MSHDNTVDTSFIWSASGRCAGVDPDLFFPEKGEDAGPAKALCRQCPVRRQCLDWALETNQKHGIWGGMTEGQRRRLRHRSSAPASEPMATEPQSPARHLFLVR